MTLRSAEEHYTREARIAYATARQVGAHWRRVRPADVDAWRDLLAPAAQVVAAGQVVAAREAEGYVAAALVEQGADVAPEADVAVGGFAGMPNGSAPVAALLDRPRILTLTAIEDGMAPAVALKMAGRHLETYALSLVQDAGRQADSVATFARPRVGWVRMVNPPCCRDCAILAGKWFKANQGFERHPRCDCRHVPAAEDNGSDVGTSPRALIESGKVRGLSDEDVRAIADGADPVAVVNARRGRAKNKMTTTESTSKRGRARRGRLTPEGIYAQAGDDRDRALELLRTHGYIR